MAKTRSHAALVINNVIQHGRSLTSALNDTTAHHSYEQALCQELCYGVMRFLPRLQFFLSQLLDKNLRNKDSDIQCVLLLGLYQLFFMRIPDHAAISESVNACKLLNKEWACKLVNAVLRQAQKQKANLQQKADKKPNTFFSHPHWLINQLQNDWPKDWQTILQANNEKPPMFLRVNLHKTSRENYLQQLNQAEIAAEKVDSCDSAVLLKQAVDVNKLPEFSAGFCSVQDAAAQQAAFLLDVQAGMKVLDACAAPGGKTCHLLEQSQGNLDLTALDNSETRLEQLHENLERLGYQCKTLCHDADDVSSWWDGQPFDRILLDAPCSGTGVIRRHPDIKFHRSTDDLKALVKIQKKLLNQLWQCLKPGGLLLYATCSVFSRENREQMNQFTQQTADASIENINGEKDWPIMTGKNCMDGFYYCKLRKLG